MKRISLTFGYLTMFHYNAEFQCEKMQKKKSMTNNKAIILFKNYSLYFELLITVKIVLSVITHYYPV